MNYKITPDANSWKLCSRRVAGENSKAVAPGEEVWAPIGYFASVEQAAMRMLEEVTRDKVGDPGDCAQIVAAIREAKAEVAEAVRAVGA